MSARNLIPLWQGLSPTAAAYQLKEFMKRSFMAIALMACASFACAGYAAVRATVVSAYHWAKTFVLDGFKLAAAKDESSKLLRVMFVQTKAFVLRLAKRERPVVTNSWRMCPST